MCGFPVKRKIIDKALSTTVVGSYPVISSSGIFSTLDPFKGAVKAAVFDQVAAGIDIISDGQVRGDIIQLFTSKLPGIKGQDVVGKVYPAHAPITTKDTKYAVSKAPRVKGIITGPTTLAYGLHLNTPIYRDREELTVDVAVALVAEARALEEAGVTLLQIDEPILSTGVADLAVGAQAIEIITRCVNLPTCIHVCGNLESVIDDVLKFKVDAFDFEFSKNPDNLDLFGSKDLVGKVIGYGCVDSSTDKVESVEEIKKRIERGIEIFDPVSTLVDPDCGLRFRSRDAAAAKLKNLVSAAREVRNEL